MILVSRTILTMKKMKIEHVAVEKAREMDAFEL